jgi:hypothetical protein
LEQFRKVRLLDDHLNKDVKLKEKRSAKQMCKNWICIPCDLWANRNKKVSKADAKGKVDLKKNKKSK